MILTGNDSEATQVTDVEVTADPARPRSAARETIVKVSLELFNRDGFDGTSIAMICEKSKIMTGNLTYYFPKKRDIVMAIKENFDRELNSVQEDLLASLLRGERQTSPWEMHHLMRSMMTTVWRHRFFLTSMISLHRLDRQIYVAFLQVEQQVRVGLAQLMQNAISAGEMTPLTYPNTVTSLADNAWYLIWGCMFFHKARDRDLEPVDSVVITNCLLQLGALFQPFVSADFISEYCREVVKSQ